MPFAELGFGCFSAEHLRLAGNASGTDSSHLAAALLAHSNCCEEGNSSHFTAGIKGFQSLYNKVMGEALHDPGAAQIARAEWAAALRFQRRECWPSFGFGQDTDIAFNPSNCCHRPFLDVDVAVVGIAKAATYSLMRILGRHPEMAAVEEPETDALTSVDRLQSHDVSLFNFWARQVRKRRPGSRILAIKHPMMVYNQQRMWRLAQIPQVKVVTILREPTEWLASMYNYFLEDCLRNETFRTFDSLKFSNLCCKSRKRVRFFEYYCEEKFREDEVPRFWEDVVDGGESFSTLKIDLSHGKFTRLLRKNIQNIFPMENMAFLDVGLLAGDRAVAVQELQRLTRFLGALRPYEDEVLHEILDEVARTRGGHEAHRVKFDRVGICKGSARDRARAQIVYESARRELADHLKAWEEAGSFVAVSPALFQQPCGSTAEE